jgi:hypothetical protein
MAGLGLCSNTDRRGRYRRCPARMWRGIVFSGERNAGVPPSVRRLVRNRGARDRRRDSRASGKSLLSLVLFPPSYASEGDLFIRFTLRLTLLVRGHLRLIF